jgi:hypothetical protein
MNKIANVENVVCSVETMSRHPELYHYTRPAAFEGIVGSQTLWCSHYCEMLDTNEVQLMRQLLPAAVTPRMDAIVDKLIGEKKLNRTNRRLWDATGGGVKMARDLVNSLYGATFDGRAVYSALDPYLFSFSTHSEDTAFDREHGVRCQWDNYATREGYCLVFDIREVAQMLRQEGSARYWAWLMLQPVRYADWPVEDIFRELVDGLANTLQQFFDRVPFPEVAVPEFLAGATLLKGAAYKAEREVRIVAVPGTAKAAKYAAKEYPGQFDATAPLPTIRARIDTGKRYIALFDGLDLRLPIKRVIVGPGARQEERAERARSLLGGDVPVTISCCP